MPDTNENEVHEPTGGRPIWSGTVSFGLVSVPVNLFPANRSGKVALHMVTEEGTPLARRYYRPRDDKEIGSDDVVRGFEVKKGKFVVIEDDELERLAPERTRDIDLKQFVKADDIDAIYFERAYYLAPAGAGATKAYKLLARVMEDEQLAGIATFVMRAKEYLTAILAENGILRAETMRFADEVRSPAEIGLPKAMKAKPADVKRIVASMKRLTKESLDKRELVDRSAQRLEALAKKKAKSGADVVKVELPEEAQQGNVIDLMERLRESLKNAS
ncbi:MAG TPA: Ku protein [Gemmatimonadaceae bacterium]|nr:Ku protein [Gemmatimonadaceae bacterium]